MAQKRRALLDDALIGDGVTRDDWIAICERFGWHCAWCREPKPLTMDHVTPIAIGGAHEPNNIQPLCQSCNSRKRLRLIRFEPDGSGVEVDPLKLLTAIVEGRQPIELVEINYRVLNQLADRQREAFNVTGFEAFSMEYAEDRD